GRRPGARRGAPGGGPDRRRARDHPRRRRRPGNRDAASRVPRGRRLPRGDRRRWRGSPASRARRTAGVGAAGLADARIERDRGPPRPARRRRLAPADGAGGPAYGAGRRGEHRGRFRRRGDRLPDKAVSRRPRPGASARVAPPPCRRFRGAMSTSPSAGLGPSAERRVATLRKLSRGLAVLVALIGATILVGWELDIEVLKSILPRRIAMNPLTALGLLLAAA